MKTIKAFLTFFNFFFSIYAFAQTSIIPGACRMETYLSQLTNKRVAVFANQTSMVGNIHLVDTLLALKVNIKKIFGPEHGFRGNADAGEQVENGLDIKTRIPIISLYGNHKKPTPEDLKDVDVIVFDIQDVGVRFYTYISSLQYVMEASLENEKTLILLDRPNPNGFYVDGPVLDTAYRSFVGMQPVPVVYGMTIGEYAMMLRGERWLSEKANQKINEQMTMWEQAFPPVRNVDVKFDIPPAYEKKQPLFLSMFMVPCIGYTHQSKYVLPINPSPNLKTKESILYYPSTCFFEGTVISEGRGTDNPFVIFGHPNLPDSLYVFTPHTNTGAKTGKFFNQKCHGWNLSIRHQQEKQNPNQLQLSYLLDAYQLFPDKANFFQANQFFDKLAGSNQLRQQIIEGKTEIEIRKSWESELEQFKSIRKRYLMYPDFE